jgi:integrase
MMIERLGERAGIHAYCHKFRHTFAVNYLLQAGKGADGAALYKLMRLLGHTDIKTTAIYLRAMDQQEARRGGSVLDNLK